MNKDSKNRFISINMGKSNVKFTAMVVQRQIQLLVSKKFKLEFELVLCHINSHVLQ